MSEYIERNEVLKAMDTWDKFGYTHTGAFIRNPYTDDYVPYVHYEDMVKCVSNMPTADVQPVVRGKWIERHDDNIILGHCSVCGWNAINGETDVMGMNFCPNCGADMRGDRNDED